jgi:transketolase
MIDSHNSDLIEICKSVRSNIIKMTTTAGSGHPTSSLSSVELMIVLLFGQDVYGENLFNCDWKNFEKFDNDRVLFSKGHASPLFYSMFFELGLISLEDLLSYRKFNSTLEGHPTPRFPYTLATTGSLGQGLGIGYGLAMANKIDNINKNIWVLIGDSEMAEGSNWETLQLASHNNLSHLIGIIDINRLGQSGETMLGWDVETLYERLKSFGWQPIIIRDGHNIEEVESALEIAKKQANNSMLPTMILATTIKGKGVSFLENKEGWHGKTLNQKQASIALNEISKS